MDLKRLQHLVLLAEELNFSRAAERAFLSQAAFSRSIQALETEFGIRLFDRGTRSVQLTMSGRQMLKQARDLLSRAKDVTQAAAYLAQAEGGSLHLGASLFAVDTVLPGLLSSFTRHRPTLRVNLEVSQWQVLQRHLVAEDIEFFIAYAGDLAKDPQFSVTALAPRPASLYCRSGHPLLQGTAPGPHPKEVPEFPWAMVQVDALLTTQLRGLFDMPEGSELPLVLRCDNQALLRESVLCSDTILFTWEAWLRPELQSGSVVDLGARLQPAIPAQARLLSLGIVQLAGRTLSPVALKFIELIQSREMTAGLRGLG